MMETMILPQVGMRLRTLKINKRGQISPNKKRERKEAIKKRKGPNKKIIKKMREKERRDNVTILIVE